MKHLLLLLFTTACLAQNAKVTAYRLVATVDDGPCSIVSYVNSAEGGLLSYVTAESNDQQLINNLLIIKKQAKKWKKSDCGCNGRYGLQWGSIPNMYVIESKNGNDTLFTNHNNTQVIFPKYEAGHEDKEGILARTLTGNIKEFFEHDFRNQIRSLFFPEENDSITADKILYQEKNAVKIFNKNFEKDTGKFKLVSRDSLYNDIERKYAFNNDTIRFFGNNIDITITYPDSGWNVGGLKVGDAEEKLIAKYPLSTSIQKYYHIRYEDIVRNYFYWVLLADKKGSITYFIKDYVIDKIEVNLN
jgi:hypothetical protein